MSQLPIASKPTKIPFYTNIYNFYTPTWRTFFIFLLFPLAYLIYDFQKWATYQYKSSKRKFLPPKSGDDNDSIEIFGRKFEHPEHIFTRNLRKYMGNVVEKVLADPKVNREGLNFLDRLLHHPMTHETANFILVNVLQDPTFIQGSHIYGTDLIAYVIQQPEAQEQFKQLILRTLKNESVRKETVNVLGYIAAQKESEEIIN